MAVNPGKKQSTGLLAVGRYELKEKLGEGGMGVVWRAFDSRIGGDVAVKIMKDCSDPAALELFSKEWRALADLSHPNIVDVRDVDVMMEDGEQKPFFIMPLLRGTTLADLIAKSSERLTVARVVEIITQVCRGLQAAHQKGLIHRDLKPSNIFVMDDDTAKVIDFGVVFLAGTKSITGRKGTFQYMSPEQMLMKEVTPASDLFAVGVILYEALTGRKPFACPTVEGTSQAVLKSIPPPVSEINPGIPHPVSQVVNKCLAKDPIHRFSTAKELSETLQRAFRGEEVFDASKLLLRIERIKNALKTDEGYASELLSQLESEGHQHPEISLLRSQIDMTMKQRRIRQLLETAKERIEQGEIVLGLDKLREVLVLDPENVDALALKASTESKRSEAQVVKWVELATTHLGNCDFVAARHAAQEALANRPGDTRALELLNRIDTIESEAKRIREQKEQLYNTAMRAYQNGEIDSALSRMGRLFSVLRSRPEGAVPERDAVYESFYQQVRSEHDSIHILLAEAQHQFAEGNFQQALQLCAQHLAKYPHDGTFQALKIQIEDEERQKISSYIAVVTKNADAEPDLDRRANIMREACERYPNELQFAQQLKVIRERRDLVNSIVAKARQFGERGQYSEELSQWDMLRSIHPRFPGLDFELQQCRKKRDQQAQEEEKARLVEEIVRLMDSREYSKALERVRLALNDFPGDTELEGLEKLSTDGLERVTEATRLLSLGQAAAATKNWNDSTEFLRKALKLEPRNIVIKETLINVLTEQARTLLDNNLPEADRLYQEAAALDGNHRAVRTLGTEISEARRQGYVGQCLTDARILAADGNFNGAYERIQKGREEYPNDLRLKQYEASLLKENTELRMRQDRAARLAELRAERQRLERNPDSEKAREVLRRAQQLSTQAPDDPDTIQGVADAEQTVQRVMGTEWTVRPDDDDTLDATRLSSPQKGKGPAEDAKAPQKTTKTKPVAVGALGSRRKWILIGGLCAAVLVAVLLVRYFTNRKPPNSQTPPQLPTNPTTVHVNVAPADSTILVNANPVSGGNIQVRPNEIVHAEISRLGYQSTTLALDGKATTQTVSLVPLETRVSVATGEKSGEVQLDGTKVGDLVDGSADDVRVPADGQSHSLALVAGGKRTVELKVKSAPGNRPELEPIGNQNVVVVTTLGTNGTVYGGAKLKSASFLGMPLNMNGDGSGDISLSNGPNELTYTAGDDASSLSVTPTEWPAMIVQVLGAPAMMRITANVDTATLTVNGKPLKRGRSGWQISQPGSYTFVLSAEHYDSQTWIAELKPHQSINDARKLVKSAPPPSQFSMLVVAGGTLGTHIDVDGKTLGDLNAGSDSQFQGVLGLGTHQILFRKDGFCDVRAEVVAKPPVDTHVTVPRLEPCGSLTFRAREPQWSAKVRHVGDATASWVVLPNGKRVQLPVGTYEAQIDFAEKGAMSMSDLTVTQHDAEFAPNPPPPPANICDIQNMGDVSVSGGWLKPKDGSNPISLTPGCVNVVLTFRKLKGPLGSHKKVTLTLHAADGHGQIEYDVDGNKLTRKVAGHSETKPVLNGDADMLQLQIRVEDQQVLIRNEKGESLDSFTASDPGFTNFRGGHIEIKTAADFKISGGN
jgi:serine/threonine-protein kinase